MSRFPLTLAVSLLVLLGWHRGLEAVVVVPSDAIVVPTGVDPLHAPLVANVGCFPGEVRKSAVYIGSGRVVTARHAYESRERDSVWIDGRHYALEPRKTVVIRNPDGAAADLVVLRLKEKPSLPEIKLAQYPPFSGERVVLAGFGNTREGPRKCWRLSSAGDWQETESSDPGTVAVGYGSKVDRGDYVRGATWGENAVAGRNLTVRAGGDSSELRAFCTLFDLRGLPLEAQAGPGDSGGAVFVQRAGGWELAGIIYAVGPGNLRARSVPPDVVAHGMATYAADVAFYREQILGAVPEPDSALLFMLAVVFVLAVRRRRLA